MLPEMKVYKLNHFLEKNDQKKISLNEMVSILILIVNKLLDKKMKHIKVCRFS